MSIDEIAKALKIPLDDAKEMIKDVDTNNVGSAFQMEMCVPILGVNHLLTRILLFHLQCLCTGWCRPIR